MLMNYLQKSEDYETFSLKEEAEIKLIQPLLSYLSNNNYNIDIIFKLASYPTLEESKKNQTVSEIISLLWPLNAGKTLLDAYEELEKYLRAIGRRDHYLHLFLTLLLGWNIIKFIDKKKPINQIIPMTCIDDLFELWVIAAIGHDLGYVIQEAESIAKGFQELYGRIGADDISKVFGESANKIKKLLKTKGKKIRLVDLLKRLISTMKDNLLLNKLVGVKWHEVDFEILSGIELSLGIKRTEALQLQEMLKDSTDHGYISSLLIGKVILTDNKNGNIVFKKDYI